jgi:hypothetical protein
MKFPLSVRFAHPGHGWPGQGERAKEHGLAEGEVYVIRSLEVGRSSSSFKLAGVDGEFNTVLFDAVYDEMDDEFPATVRGGHALVVEFGDEELIATCLCGVPLGTGTPLTSLDEFALPWERHVITRSQP